MKRFCKTFCYRLCAFIVAWVLMVPMVAGAASNGCDDSDNEYITPELALCSTHVYNIGQTTNPSNDTERGYMKDMVALKSTIMTQQLNKQYEYLESMIRRFKTQLEKAILTTRLQTSGAATGGASSGGAAKSDDKYIVLSGTQNCMKMVSVDASLACLQSNVRIAMDAVSAGNVRDAKKQLEQDLASARSMQVVKNTPADCANMNAARKSTVSDCANSLNWELMNFIDNRNRQQKKE